MKNLNKYNNLFNSFKLNNKKFTYNINHSKFSKVKNYKFNNNYHNKIYQIMFKMNKTKIN
jgi:hypothetical protein